MMMSDEQGLLAAIRHDPENDDLRRIYADWLEEHDQPERAEFVRVQLELASLREGAWETDFSRCRALELREAELRWQYSDDWLADLPSPDGVEWQFERGLPSWARFDSFTVFERYAKRLFRVFLIERLTIEDFHRIAEFAPSPLLSSILALELPDHAISSEGIEALANSRRLGRLRRLRLAGDNLDVFGARALAKSLIGQLRYLDLECRAGESLLEDAAVQALVQSTPCPQLRTLRLDRNAIGYDGSGFLAESTALSGLEVLSLAGNRLETAGVCVLARASQLRRLRSLCLRGNDIEADGVAALAQSPLLTRLVSLDLTGNPIGDAGVAALVDSPAATRLVALELGNCRLSDEAVVSLARSPMLANLRLLRLSGNQIGEKGARALATAPGLALESLELLDNPIPVQTQRWLKERLGKRVRAGDFWGNRSNGSGVR
jgi:uncharacterized protein (TIGR02996 family)